MAPQGARRAPVLVDDPTTAAVVPAQGMTVAVHLLGGLLLCVGLVF